MIEQVELAFRLSQTSSVRAVLNGNITQESIDLLIRMLEISKDTFPTNAELKADVEALRVVISHLVWQGLIEWRIKRACAYPKGKPPYGNSSDTGSFQQRI